MRVLTWVLIILFPLVFVNGAIPSVPAFTLYLKATRVGAGELIEGVVEIQNTTGDALDVSNNVGVVEVPGPPPPGLTRAPTSSRSFQPVLDDACHLVIECHVPGDAMLEALNQPSPKSVHILRLGAGGSGFVKFSFRAPKTVGRDVELVVVSANTTTKTRSNAISVHITKGEGTEDDR